MSSSSEEDIVYENLVIQELPEYEVVKILGKGHYGNVDEAKLTNTGELVAIKSFNPYENNNPSGEGLLRFTMIEIECLQLCKGCDHILQLLRVGLQLKDGASLVKIMTKSHTSDLDNFIKIVPIYERIRWLDSITVQLLSSLSVLHNRRILHRDIKPQNILVDYIYDSDMKLLSREGAKCYLADFGISHIFTDEEYVNEERAYTAYYRPPEVCADMAYNENADMWALGITLIEYITGERLITDIESDEVLAENNEILTEIFNNLEGQSAFDGDALIRNEIHDNIDVVKIIKAKISEENYKRISSDTLNLLKHMLEVNMNDRLMISELIGINKECPMMTKVVARGPLKSEMINQGIYYMLVEWIINVCRHFKLLNNTIILSIDIFERYLSKIDNITREEIKLVALSAMSLASKLFEEIEPDMRDFVEMSNGTYNSEETKKLEMIIFKELNYMLLPNEINKYLIKVSDSHDIANNIIYLSYQNMKKYHYKANELSYDDLISRFVVTKEEYLKSVT